MRISTSSRFGDLADRLRERRATMRSEHMERENDHLRTELFALRDELERERDERADLLKAISAAASRKPVVKKRTGVLRVIVVGGAAYLLGSRAGRERYDQAMGWLRRLRDRTEERVDEVLDDSSRPSPDLSGVTTAL
jgi:hypothetical protein